MIKLALSCILFLVMAHPLEAREKNWSISTSISSALLLDPDRELADTYINVGGEWMLNDSVAILGGGEFAVNGLLEKQLIGGLRVYPVTWENLYPHLSGGVIWQFDPEKQAGWRLAAGVDWNTELLTDWTNLFISYETSLSIFVEDPSATLWDFYRLGIKLAF